MKKKLHEKQLIPDFGFDECGSVAVAKNGRFAGREFIILAGCGDGFCLVADGKHRRIANPKLKNVKHIEIVGHDLVISRSIREGRVTDGEIRKKLADFRRSECMVISEREESNAER